MKIVLMAVLLITVAALAYVYYNSNHVMEMVTGTLKLVGSSVDADNLEGKAVKPFTIPKGHCKAYFPGDPHTPSMEQELFSVFLYSGTSEMMADKQMTYYLSEFTAPSMGVAIVNPNDVSPFVQSKFAELKLDSWQGGPTAPVGNNDAVLANNVQSDVIKAQNAIDHFIDDWAKNKKATIESRVGTNLYGGRFNGVEVTGHLANEKDQFRVRCFCDYPSKSIVLIGVAGNAKRVGATSASKFLNSLEMWQ